MEDLMLLLDNMESSRVTMVTRVPLRLEAAHFLTLATNECSRSKNALVSWSYLDLRPLESEVVLGVRVCVRVEARAEEEYPAPSRGRENSRPSWKSLFLMAS